MKTKVKEKKVYKVNKALAKKALIGFGIIFLLVILVMFGGPVIRKWYLNTWKWHEIEGYNFSIKLPRAYENLLEEDEGLNLNSSAFMSEYSVAVDENYVSKETEIVFNGGNILNGISLMIQCLNTEKTTKALDEISEGNYIMTTIYYEDSYDIGTLEKEYVKVFGSDAVKNIVDLSNDTGTKTMITYLIPLEDKEITIIFLGKKDTILNNEHEIEKIISEMK